MFSDETASGMVISDTIHVMILDHDKFSQFTPKKIADANTVSEVLICLSAESKAEVDTTVEKAVNAGGKADPGRNRITASCMDAALKISTAIFGRLCGWIWKKPKRSWASGEVRQRRRKCQD